MPPIGSGMLSSGLGMPSSKVRDALHRTSLPVLPVAGLAANLAPALLRSYEEENRLMLEQQLYDKYMAMGMGPQHIGDDEQEVPLPPHPPHYQTCHVSSVVRGPTRPCCCLQTFLPCCVSMLPMSMTLLACLFVGQI